MKTSILAFAVVMCGSAAWAEGPYAPCEYPGQYAHCPGTTNPSSNTNNNVLLNQNNSASYADSRSQSKSQSQAQSKSKSISNSNSQATGGKAQQGQTQSQRVKTGNSISRGGNSTARNGNISNVNNYEESAATALAPSIAGCGGTAGGGFSAAVQTYGFGVSVGRCKGDRFEQVLIAEERAASGMYAGVGYLAAVDGSSRKALSGHVVDIREEVIETAASAACQVVEKHPNGRPKHVRAYPKPGRTKDEALASCLKVRGLFLVQ